MLNQRVLIFYGYNCVDDFCEWLFTEENRNTTVMAHNGAGYDFKFIFTMVYHQEASITVILHPSRFKDYLYDI
jgi:hypothetical protein